MFLFESSKEKAIRQDVQKNMETCISNPKKYNQSKEILAAHLRGSDQKIIEMIVDNIKSTIKNEDYQPVRKYQAMLLLKDLMLTHNKAFGKYVVKKILKRLTILAQHKSGNNMEREEERGKDIFGQIKKDQEQYAIKFFNTLLTALEEWGKNWPKAPDGPYKEFHREYNDLLMNGVQFPKEIKKNVSMKTGERPRQQVRRSVEAPKPIQKRRTSQEREQPPPRRPENSRNSNINRNLRAELDKFYEQVKQPLELLVTVLPEFPPEELPVIRDIIGQVEKTIQAGNEFIIAIENDQVFRTDDMKLKKCFDFVTKVQKDLKILSKKPQQLQTFRSKYTKLSNQLLETLTKNVTARSISPSPSNIDENSRTNVRPAPSRQDSREISPVSNNERSAEKVEERPKIKNQNRYASVQGNQVLEHFKAGDFQSNSGQSVHSDRFGSFGGPAGQGGATERHRASIPIQQIGSPDNENKQKSNTDRKSSQKKEEKTKEIIPIPQEKTLEISKRQLNESQNPISSQRPKLQSQVLFKEFEEVKQKKSEKGSVKNVPGFEDNNSFGPNQLEKPPNNEVQDFFEMLENKNNENTKDINHNPRRKKNPPKEENDDMFNPKLPSKIDSSHLSGFQFSNKVLDGSKNNSVNPPNPQKQVEVSSKKNVSAENPFGLDTSQQHNESRNSIGASNFFDKFDPNKSNNSIDFFGKSTVTEKVKTQNNQHQQRLPADNPFATGNFGNMPNIPPVIDPFDSQSQKSKKDPFNNSNDNPFGNQSFERGSKKGADPRRSVHSQKSGHSQRNDNRSVENPFQSKVQDPNENPFDMNTSKHSAANPFETMSKKSGKNPFEEVEDFFKPPTSHKIDGLSERNSFKHIQAQRNNNNILSGNLGAAGFKQPIRDSLVLSAKIDKQASQFGLDFSEFPDIAEQKPSQANPVRNSDPFNVSGTQKQDHQFSGFSLSNFPGIGQSQTNINTNQKPTDLNGSAADFFAKYENKSQKSIPKQVEKPQQKKLGFEDFNMGNSFSNGSKSDNKKSVNLNANNFLEKEKTVLSGQQKSFDFENLEKVSAIQRKKQERDVDSFTEWGKTENNTKRQGLQIDNKSQKSYSWGDFDNHEPKDQVNEKMDSKSQKHSAEPQSSRQLQVESRIKIVQPSDRPIESKGATSRVNFSNENSIQLRFQDFLPVAKKGIEWNPLSKIAKLKASPYTYNVDEKQIQMKKQQLLEKQRDYNEKVQIFKFAKHKNEQIRNIFLEKMKRVEDVIHQKTQFEQILKKLQETNGLKQKTIEQIHAKIKKAKQLKARILQKEKQLYEITKNQINTEEKKNTGQRSMSSKWQMFNKNLEYNRNSMYTAHSQYSNGY